LARPEKPKDHCDICREIREGCEAEVLADESKKLVRCAVCSNTGLIDRGDYTAVVCSACPRGYRMKLWLRHQEMSGRDTPEIVLV
jgi:hypothetical protein